MFEELSTVYCQVDERINIRTLQWITYYQNDYRGFTPRHFLEGAPLTTFVEPNIADPKISYLDGTYTLLKNEALLVSVSAIYSKNEKVILKIQFFQGGEKFAVCGNIVCGWWTSPTWLINKLLTFSEI